MKYFLAIVQNKETCALYSYDTYDEALAAFHSELAYRGEGRNSTFCLIFDENGQVLYTEAWNRQ